jgi:hypothetical protein
MEAERRRERRGAQQERCGARGRAAKRHAGEISWRLGGLGERALEAARQL